MGRLNRRVVAALAALAAVGVSLVLVGGAIDGDDRGTSVAPPSSVVPHDQQDPADCGIDVPAVEGAAPLAVCALGFGLAVPQGWNATRLDEASLERLAGAELSRPSFLPAARTAAAGGAVFYAAGVDEGGAVSDLKVGVRDGVDTGAGAVEAEARAVVDGGQVAGARLVEATAEGARVDFRGGAPSAETGEALEYHGAQLLVPDGDRLWSLVVTAEDETRRDELVDMFTTSLTFD